MHRRQGGGGNQLLALEGALAKLQSDPIDQIDDVGAGPASRRLRIRIALQRRDLPFPVAHDVGNGPVLMRHVVGEAGTGAGHSQRLYSRSSLRSSQVAPAAFAAATAAAVRPKLV